MLLPSIKQRVRESFDRAAVTYDSAAVVQRRVCDRLLDELTYSTPAPAHILDPTPVSHGDERAEPVILGGTWRRGAIP